MKRFILLCVTIFSFSGLCAIPPNPANLILPPDVATRNSIYPTFFWSAPTTGPEPDYYYVCLSETYPPTIDDEIGFVTTLEFTSAVPLNYNTIYYWTVIASNASGTSTNNVIRSLTTIGEEYLMESFESGIIPPEWTVLNSDNGEYFWGVQSWTSYGGANSVGITYESTTLQNDDWLITPPLQLSSTETDQISYWLGTFNPSFPEEWEVLVSTTNTEPASFIMIDSGVSTTYGYNQYVYNLDSYGDAIIYFAFRYRGLNDDTLILDEFIGPHIYQTIDIPSPVVSISHSAEGITLNWAEIPQAAEYRIYTSNDLVNWTTTYTTVIAPAHTYAFDPDGILQKFFMVKASDELSRAITSNPFRSEAHKSKRRQ